MWTFLLCRALFGCNRNSLRTLWLNLVIAFGQRKAGLLSGYIKHHDSCTVDRVGGNPWMFKACISRYKETKYSWLPCHVSCIHVWKNTLECDKGFILCSVDVLGYYSSLKRVEYVHLSCYSENWSNQSVGAKLFDINTCSDGEDQKSRKCPREFYSFVKLLCSFVIHKVQFCFFR